MNTDRLDYLRIKYTRLNMKAGAQNKGLCRGRAVDMYTEHEFTDEKIKVEEEGSNQRHLAETGHKSGFPRLQS